MIHVSSFNLRARLLVLVLVGIGPAAGLILHEADEDRRREATQLEHHSKQLAHLVAHEEEQLLQGTRQLLVVLAQVPVVRGAEPTRCSAFFADLLKRYQRYLNFGVIGVDGEVRCSALPLTESLNLADRDYFRQALQTREFSIGQYQVGRITGKPSLSLAYPILDARGQPQAIVFATLNLDWLDEHQFAFCRHVLPTATSTTIDAAGVVLARHPDQPETVGQPLLERSILQAMGSQDSGVVQAPGPKGVTVFAFAKVSNSLRPGNLSVILGVPRAILFAEVNRAQHRNLAVLAICAGLILALGWASSQVLILRPLDALIRMARQIAAGDLSARVGLAPRFAELDQLARVLNQTAESLAQRENERQRAEETLEKSEVRYRRIVETSEEGIWMADRNWKTTFVNARLEQMLGYGPGEMLGRSIFDFMDDEGHQLAQERMARRERGLRDTLDFKFIRRDGMALWVVVATSPVISESGEFDGALAMLTDITERKRAEHALRDSEVRYRSLYTAMDEAVALHEVIYDADSKAVDFVVLDVNPAYEVNVGIKNLDIVGRRISERFNPPPFLDIYAKVVKTGAPVFFEAYFAPLQKHFSISAFAFGAAKFATVFRDITARKRAELLTAAFLTLEERLNAVATVADAATIVVEVADNLLKWDACLVGLYSAEQDLWDLVLRMDTIGGQKLTVPYMEPGRPGPLMRRVFREGGQLIPREQPDTPVPDLDPFGNESRLSASLMFVPMRIGEQVVGVLSIQSYTPHAYTGDDLRTFQALADHCSSAVVRTRAQEALRTSEESLHQLSVRLLLVQDEERRRLARELHDSVAQKLAAVAMNVSRLKSLDATLDGEGRAVLADIAGLVDQCSDEVGTMCYLLHPPVLEALGLADAVRDYADGFARRSGLRVDLEIAPDVGRLSKECELALFRVLQESLGNIHRHSGSRTASISLWIEAGEVRLEIKDSGRGIPVEILQTLKERAGGGKLGVGLAGMRERMRQLSGRLEISSSGSGTSIHACLPLTENPV